jgi:Galactose oxidase, central domain/Kelch motif
MGLDHFHAHGTIVKEGKMRNGLLCLLLLFTVLILTACGPAESLKTTVSLPTVIKETQVVEVTRVVTQVIVKTVEIPVPIVAAPPVITEAPQVATEAPQPAPTEARSTQRFPIVPLVEVAESGSMLIARARHTATQLPDGRILIVGGYTREGYLAEAEIFNPLTNQTTQIASMNSPRQDHTATLLNDGRVLVVGGYNYIQNWLNDSEVYDVSNDSWTVVPMLATHGVQHSATLMKDGRVLVVGGVDESGMGTDRVEIYDPQTNSWWGAMPLSSDRASHTAQLLEDGRVLIVGGEGVLGYPEIGDALIYDPYTNTWTQTGPMIKPRINAQSVRLPDGKVLVAGGINLEDTIPGAPPIKMSNNAEIYDPQLNAWFATGNLNEARYGHGMVLLHDGRVMVMGGVRDYDSYWSESSFVREVELWDPGTGIWSIGYQLPVPGAYSACAVLQDGRVWLSGGRTGTGGETFLADTWMIIP